MPPFLIVVLILILWAEFVNGWTDAPNSITTVVATKVLSSRQAIIMAVFLNIIGTLSGTAVAKTIGTEIVKPEIINLYTVGSAMMGIILWSTLAWKYGLPTSESHALISGLTGSALALAGPKAILWEGWKKVIIGLFFSTFFGYSLSYLIFFIIGITFHNVNISKVRKIFGRAQIFSAAFMAFSHGSNDGQKFIGAFSLALFIGGSTSYFTIPFWVIVLCALTMGLGTMIGGWRIIKTLGIKLTKLEPQHGFAAETAAASAIEIASRLGVPLSTTHTISTAIIGVGAAQRKTAVRWEIAGNIVTAWILTFPICGTISWVITKIFLLVIKVV